MHTLFKWTAVFERSSKNKSSYCQEMARRMNMRMHISRLRRHKASKGSLTITDNLNVPVATELPLMDKLMDVTSAGSTAEEVEEDDEEDYLPSFRRLVMQLRRQPDAVISSADGHEGDLVSAALEKSYEYSYVENFQKVTLEFYGTGDTGLFKGPVVPGGQVPQFIHPFLSMSSFSEIILASFLADSSTRFNRCLDDLVTDFRNRSPNPRYRMELLQGIRCSGITEFYIPSFHIYCDSRMPYNKKVHIDNKVFYQKFSWIEVNFGDEEAIVRVLAIVRISPAFYTRDSHGHIPLGEVRLVVIKLKECVKEKGLFGYSFTQANQETSAPEGPEIHVIELSSIIRPACVFPVFTKTSTSPPTETYAHNEKRTYKMLRFNRILVHSIRNFDVSNSYTERGTSTVRIISSGINAPLNLSKDQIADIEKMIGEGEVGYDDGGEGGPRYDDQVEDDDGENATVWV